jgi:hypothetical protein
MSKLLLPWALVAFALPSIFCAAQETRSVSVAGEWRLRLDPSDAGIAAEWAKSASSSSDRIQLPGSTDEQHFGTKNEGRELLHLTHANSYVGAAWYEREITIPEAWRGKRITLLLERCHWETRAWLDGYPLGLQNSLSTPQIYELGEAGKPGVTPGVHRLTLRVDNRPQIDIGWSSAITEEGPGNWNGIAGRMEMRATDAVWIDRVYVYPDPARNLVHVKVKIRNDTGETAAANLTLTVGTTTSSTGVIVGNLPVDTIERDLPLASPAQPWSEFSAAVQELTVALNSTQGASASAAGFSDEARTTFGLRALTTAGKQMMLNGRVIHLRGTVDNGSFPLKGFPPTDVETWRARLQIYQDYGFNHIRFHSWCPPDAAFTAADELGLVFQVENPMWMGDGRVSADDRRTQFIDKEAHRIVDTYGNHPSFALMSMGNEEGSGQDPFLGNLVRSLQADDPRHFYTSTSAPDNFRRPDNYFVSAGPEWKNLRGDPRFEQYPPDTAFDYRQYVDKVDRPIVAHELGQWTVFPDLNEARKYTGPLQPRYLDIYREALQRNGLLGEAEAFRQASGAFMVALYKEEIESNLRTPGLTGFQLLGITDWPGFGPAFTGVLDTLSESKGLIAPEAFRRFSSPTVPLVRLKKRTWTTNETLEAPVEIAHYGPADIDNLQASWILRDTAGRTVASGQLPPANVPTGGRTALGTIRLELKKYPAPARYSMQVSAGAFVNDWDLWLYPEKFPAPTSKIVIATRWDDATREQLAAGRTVVLLLDPQQKARTVPTVFTTAFWSNAWFPDRRETMGILCEPSHGALKEFPTATHADWQWWDLTRGSRAFVLTGAPAGLKPVVQVIDDAARSFPLGAVFEARVGRGKLLATSFDLINSLDTRLAARQLRYSLLRYAASRDFDPRAEVKAAYLDELFSAPPALPTVGR